MNEHYRDIRKIDPSRGAFLADGSPNDKNRVEIGPTQLAFAEWEAAGLNSRPILKLCESTAGSASRRQSFKGGMVEFCYLTR